MENIEEKGPVQIRDLESQIAKLVELRAAKENLKLSLSDLENDITSKEMFISDMLESEGLSSYKAKAGTFSYKYEQKYKSPQTEEDRKAFFDYLKSIGRFEDMVSVHSATLNSWAKQEIESGRLEIPGLVLGSPVLRVSLRKA